MLVSTSTDDSWTGKPHGFSDAEDQAYRTMQGSPAIRLSTLSRSNRVLAVELQPSGIRRFMILNGIYQHHSGDILASYGNSMTNSRPVRIGKGILDCFASVLWESQAKAEHLLYSPTLMPDWTHPDGTPFTPDESGLPDVRANAADPAVVALLPKAMLLSSDIPGDFHGRTFDQALTATERTKFPSIAAFFDAVNWLQTNNGDTALGPTTTFLDWSAIDKSPWEDSTVPILLKVYPATSIHGLSTVEESFITYTAHHRALVAPFLHVPKQPPAPVPGPVLQAPPPSAPAEKLIADALVALTQRGNRSQAEQESLNDRLDAGTTLRLLFCRLIDNTTNPIPGTEDHSHLVVLPALDELFDNSVLRPHASLQATKRLANLWNAYSDMAANQTEPTLLLGSLEANATLITEFFVSQIRSGDYCTTSVSVNPDHVRSHITLLLFGPPALSADEYDERIAQGRRVQHLVSQGEQSRNHAKKVTSHDPMIAMTSRSAFLATVSALAAFERITVKHESGGHNQYSLLVDLLNKDALGSLVRTPEATHWFRKNAGCHTAMIHLFLQFETIFRDMAQFASSSDANRAALAAEGGYIMDTNIIQTVRNLQQVARNRIAITASKLVGPIPLQWLEESAVSKFFRTQSPTGAATSTSPTKRPAATTPDSAVSPSKKTKSPSSSNPNAPTTPARLVLTAEERASKEAKGLLTYTGEGRKTPSIPISLKLSGQTEAKYLCRDYALQGRACTWPQCRHLHLNSLNQLDADSATQLKTFIATSKEYKLTRDAPTDKKTASTSATQDNPTLSLRTNALMLTLPTTLQALAASRGTPFRPLSTGKRLPVRLTKSPHADDLTTTEHDSSKTERHSVAIHPSTPSTFPTIAQSAGDELPSTETKRSREEWARATLPPDITTHLWNPHGKEIKNVVFMSTVSFRHIIPHLFASGYMSRPTKSRLCTASKAAREFDILSRKYRDIDFQDIRLGLPIPGASTNEMMNQFRAKITACFLHFCCWTPHVVRFIGGSHTGSHRPYKAISSLLLREGVAQHIVDDLARTLRSGSPRYYNAEFSDKNFRAALAYGNHPTVAQTPELADYTKKCLEKDITKGFALALDPRLIYFVPHIHLTPIGLSVLPGRKPRIFFDSSFRPKHWSLAINDATDASKEPMITFAGSFVTQLAWLWNLRITYPAEEIYLGDDDVSGAFRQIKYHPNVVSLHSCLLFGYLFMYTGQTFGDATSPPNWEPIVTARKALAQRIWQSASVSEQGKEVLPTITLSAPPTRNEIDAFPQPLPDSLNRGVLNADGSRKPPPYPHHVDDCYYGDVSTHFYKTVVSSLLALRAILQKPSVWNHDPISWEKFNSEFSYTRRMNGWIVDSRRLTVILPDDKREALLKLLVEWTTKPSFTIRELAILLGTLTAHSKPIPWFRARYAPLFFAMQSLLLQRYHTIRHYELRKQIEAKIDVQLPSELKFRLSSIVATEVAAKIWRSKNSTKITPPISQAVVNLHQYVSNPNFRWEGSIGHMIQRDPDFEGYGDASLIAGGGYNTKLRYYFVCFWGPNITKGFTLQPHEANYCHINEMEFVVILLQLAGIITWIRENRWNGIAPTALLWSDNTSSSAWAAAVHAKSPRVRGLIELYSQLLEETGMKPRSEYVSTDDNHQADHLPPNFRTARIDRSEDVLRCNSGPPRPTKELGTIRSRRISFFQFLARLGVTDDWVLKNYTPIARVKVFALWTADLASGETLHCRILKAATVKKYLRDTARFISGFTGEDPRKANQMDTELHPLIQRVLDEITRYEKISDKREPHTPLMQQQLRSSAIAADIDSLPAAMADWCALGLVLGHRISEWGQEEGNTDPFHPKQAPTGETYAFTWANVEARLIGNHRVDLTEAITTQTAMDIESFTVTFTWQKNNKHGEKKLLVRSPTLDLCPVHNLFRILQRYHRLLGSANITSPLAVYRGIGNNIYCITARNVAAALRTAAQHAYKIDPATPTGRKDLSRWSSHSLRVGACVILHLNGFSTSEIKFLLRWESDAFMAYLRNLGTLSRKQNAAISETDATMPNLI